MRELKFKVWGGVNYMSKPFTLNDLQSNIIQFTSDCIVMQYTGFKDKKGREVYEFDIIRINEANRLYTVEFVDSGFKLIHADPKLSRMHWGYLHRIEECEFTFEVIGNIHENHHLLNK